MSRFQAPLRKLKKVKVSRFKSENEQIWSPISSWSLVFPFSFFDVMVNPRFFNMSFVQSDPAGGHLEGIQGIRFSFKAAGIRQKFSDAGKNERLQTQQDKCAQTSLFRRQRFRRRHNKARLGARP